MCRVELVHQTELQCLVRGAGPTHDVHVHIARDRLRLCNGALDVGNEREGCRASGPDLAWPVRRHEDRHLERRILAPAVHVVVGPAPSDDRTQEPAKIS